MRQAGLKPKSHSSGVYWTRAASKRGKNDQKKEADPSLAFDFDNDGEYTAWDKAGWFIVACGVVAWFGFLIYLEVS
jgi:hypothetical protein